MGLVNIDWRYANANPPDLRWTALTGYEVGVLTFLLNAGRYDDEVTMLREITTKARLVSEELEEHGVVSGSDKASNPAGQ